MQDVQDREKKEKEARLHSDICFFSLFILHILHIPPHPVFFVECNGLIGYGGKACKNFLVKVFFAFLSFSSYFAKNFLIPSSIYTS
jgi:hypothetical protein